MPTPDELPPLAEPYREFELNGWEAAAARYADSFERATTPFIEPLLDALAEEEPDVLRPDSETGVHAIELNVSCPNTAEGKTFEEPSAFDGLLTAVMAARAIKRAIQDAGFTVAPLQRVLGPASDVTRVSA